MAPNKTLYGFLTQPLTRTSGKGAIIIIARGDVVAHIEIVGEGNVGHTVIGKSDAMQGRFDF